MKRLGGLFLRKTHKGREGQSARPHSPCGFCSALARKAHRLPNLGVGWDKNSAQNLTLVALVVLTEISGWLGCCLTTGPVRLKWAKELKTRWATTYRVELLLALSRTNSC